MPSFLRLIGGVKGPSPRDTAFPPVAHATFGKFTGAVRKKFPRISRPAYQSHAGSCGPHAVSFVAESDALAREDVVVQCCRMDLYFGARWLEHEETQDVGVIMDDLYRWLREYGTVSEGRKAYAANEVNTWRPDPAWVKERAAFTADLQPMPLVLDPILAELEADRCVVFAHHVYGQMANTTNPNGDGTETGPDNGPRLGGHARAFCGFDLDKDFGAFGKGGLLIRNHWSGWGIPHPLAGADKTFAGHRDSYSWLPVSRLAVPSFIYDVARLARGLPVEGV